MNERTPPHFHVAIAGTGFGGLGMAIRMKQEGLNDFVVLERAGDVGGVWRDNSYPGCACDVQSHLYSFSFAPNPNWSRAYSPQAEIHAYLKDCARKFGVLPHVRFHHEVKDAVWQDDRQAWRIETSQGVITADVFVSGVGALSDPSIPKLPGLETFAGKVMHSAQWDHEYELDGKRVAVIGTGASAIQFVPRIQPKVGKLHLFQRTPPWVLPRRDHDIKESSKALFRKSSLALKAKRASIYGLRELLVLGFKNPNVMQRAHKLAVRYLERVVKDPELRQKLTPDYTLGCKRVLISDDYLQSLVHPNVDVVTSGIREIRAHSIVGNDGVEREIDALIFGTGFHVTDLPIARQVRGRDGRSLKETWAGSPKAHLGTSVAGYPNFFILQGPNTGLGHTSVITMIESQIEHVLRALRFLDDSGASAIEPRAEAQAAFVAEVDDMMKGTVWTSGGCQSWYLDETGRNSTLWPSFTFTFARRVEGFEPSEYLAVTRRRSAAIARSAAGNRIRSETPVSGDVRAAGASALSASPLQAAGANVRPELREADASGQPERSLSGRPHAAVATARPERPVSEEVLVAAVHASPFLDEVGQDRSEAELRSAAVTRAAVAVAEPTMSRPAAERDVAAVVVAEPRMARTAEVRDVAAVAVAEPRMARPAEVRDVAAAAVAVAEPGMARAVDAPSNAQVASQSGDASMDGAAAGALTPSLSRWERGNGKVARV